MTDWSLDFDMSPAGRLAGALLLILIFTELRHTLLRRGRPPRRATLMAFGCTLLPAVLLMLAGRLSDRWLVVPCAGLLIVSAVRRYAAPAGATSRGLRGLMIALRVTALLILLVLIARPVLTQTTVIHARPIIDVLIDHSRSMRLRDGRDAKSLSPRRMDRLAAAIKASPSGRDRLTQKCDLQIFGFNETSRRLNDWLVGGGGASTGIGAALDALSAKPDALPAAILLLSDGRETLASADAARAAADKWAARHVPIIAVGVGETAPNDLRRIELADMIVPAETIVGSELPVRAVLRVAGLQGAGVVIECRVGEVIAERREVAVDKSLFETPMRFHVTMNRPGFHRIELRARLAKPSMKPDTDPRAAESRHVLVREERIHVLLIESHPRSESAFIARALGCDARMKVTSLLAARPAEGLWTNPLPRDLKSWLDYHLVILGDVGRGELARSTTDSLVEAVSRHGVGMVTLGGTRQFDVLRSGPLADLSPTDFDPRRVARDVRARLTPSGLLHPITRIAENDGDLASTWSTLPASPTACTLGQAKPAAEVLVMSENETSLIAVMTAGRGRSVAVGFDSTWRWSMQADAGRAMHARFWRQLAMWTARREPALLVRTDRPRYELCASPRITPTVQVEARLVDPLTGKPPEDAAVEIEWEPLSGLAASSPATQPVMVARKDDRWIGAMHPSAPGEYVLRATARSPGNAQPMTAETRFEVINSDPEMDYAAPDFTLLRAIAAATAANGGGFYLLENLAECLEKIELPTQRRPIVNTLRIAVAEQHAALLLAVICAALILEWSLRRRRGFV